MLLDDTVLALLLQARAAPAEGEVLQQLQHLRAAMEGAVPTVVKDGACNRRRRLKW